MTAKLKPTIPSGGILSQHVDQDFADFVAGRPGSQRVVVGVVETAGISSGNQDKGRVNHTAYEFLHLVEITDAHEADRLRHLITTTRADRGFAVRQPELFAATEDEQRESLLDMIRDWASEQDLAMADVDAKWLEYFGGSVHAASETVQASRSVAQLKEFAYHVGVIAETDADERPVGDDPDDDAEPVSAAPAIPFQSGDEQ